MFAQQPFVHLSTCVHFCRGTDWSLASISEIRHVLFVEVSCHIQMIQQIHEAETLQIEFKRIHPACDRYRKWISTPVQTNNPFLLEAQRETAEGGLGIDEV